MSGKRTILFTVLALVTSMFGTAGSVAAQTGDEGQGRPDRLSGVVSDDFELRSPDDVVQVFIELDEPSVAEFAARAAPSRLSQRSQGRAVLDQQQRVRNRLSGLIREEHSNLVVGANGLRADVRLGDLPVIRAAEGVESVAPVTRYHLTNSTSVPWIGGGQPEGGGGYRGEGVSVAIIDTGVDYLHAALGGSGDSDAYEENEPGLIEPGTFPTGKVVDGYDFAGPTYDASDPALSTPDPDPDPLDVHGHGTHVAATAAGIGSDEVGPGMAPGADVYAYKVFGDEGGSTDLVADAIERALDPDQDLSLDDSVDVINLSLGAPFGHPGDPSAIAAQNAVDNGVVVVASAGNSGPIPYVTGSPAVAEDVISVAASVDGGVEVPGIDVTFPGGVTETMEAQPGNFGNLTDETQGALAIADPLDACTGIGNAAGVAGQVVLVERGMCTFTDKVRAAEAAEAAAVVVFNDRAGPPITMGHDGSQPVPAIPAVMVGHEDGERLRQEAAEGEVTVRLSDEITIARPELADTLAEFSSRGPGFGNTFKPDLSAPGFNIASAAAGTGGAAGFSSGTSMAAPHAAGAAAQLLEWDRDLTPAQVKGLLMGSTTPAAGDGGEFQPGAVPIASQGTGVVQVDRVVDGIGGYATPGGVVFHVNPTGPTTETATVDVTRLGADAVYDVEIQENQTLDGVTWSVSRDTLATDEGSASVQVVLEVDPSLLEPDDGRFSQTESDGWLVLANQESPGDEIRVGLVAVVDPASSVSASGGQHEVTLSNEGPGDGSAEGFTRVGGGSGSLAGIGFRTGTASAEGGGSPRTVDFGLVLSEPWASPSGLELQILLDVDEDGSDDYALVAADRGLLQGIDPTGEVATALFDLAGGGGVLLHPAQADLNDRVIVLPADLTGDSGFLDGSDDRFDMTVVVLDQLGVSGTSDTLTVDLGAEVVADSLTWPAAEDPSGAVPVQGEGDMLWIFPNNAVPDQHAIVGVGEPPPPEGDQPPATSEPPDDGGEPSSEEEPPVEESSPPPEPPGFDDVGEGHLFHSEIRWLAGEGITLGCDPPGNERFCPDQPVSRGQMAAFLTRALDLAATGEEFFDDVDASVFQADIDRLAAAGITRGCNPPQDDRFCPDEELTRAEMATFMARGFGFSTGRGADLFEDDDDLVHEPSIDVIGTADVTRGCNPPAGNRFCPSEQITRGEMAAFLYRAFRASGLME